MPKSPRELTAPDLVKRWRTIVNDHVMMGRDSHLLHEALIKFTPVQIILGMYRFRHGNNSYATATIPMFLKAWESWVEDDDVWAEIDLACYVSSYHPAEYYTYLDYFDEESVFAFRKSSEARSKLREWADKVLQ